MAFGDLVQPLSRCLAALAVRAPQMPSPHSSGHPWAAGHLFAHYGPVLGLDFGKPLGLGDGPEVSACFCPMAWRAHRLQKSWIVGVTILLAERQWGVVVELRELRSKEAAACRTAAHLPFDNHSPH